ncbi:hypothetical protein CURTO8I2_90008 [Curtobacterium sp. 8I-2]|nr:hypothetical protein CURTO8I2_90008 [Curtobacterium sp. 8I-2]
MCREPSAGMCRFGAGCGRDRLEARCRSGGRAPGLQAGRDARSFPSQLDWEEESGVPGGNFRPWTPGQTGPRAHGNGARAARHGPRLANGD